MKIVTNIVVAAALLALVGVLTQPAWAACTTARVLNTGDAYLVSNPNWGGAGGTRTCSLYYGCYAYETGGGPISSDFAGLFWALQNGDPTVGAGIDNGDWDVSDWSKSPSAEFYGVTYYYPAWLTVDGGLNSDPGSMPNWGGSAGIDGCITHVGNPEEIDPEECTCVLLSDEWDAVGYFAVLSNFTDAFGNFDLTPDTFDAVGFSTIRLGPVPEPLILNLPIGPGDTFVPAPSDRDPITGDVFVDAAIDPLPSDAVQQKGGCDCQIGYQVYFYRTSFVDPAPVSRSGFCSGPGQKNCWGIAAAPDGTNQPFTPASDIAMVRVPCDPNLFEHVYVATRLALDPDSAGGFSAGQVSASSPRIECDPINEVTCEQLLTHCEWDLGLCEEALSQREAELAACETSLAEALADADDDGVRDSNDLCVATPGGSEVDQQGCSIEQFCSFVDTGTPEGVARCKLADWRNDEPVGNPFDCSVETGTGVCIPR